VISNIASENGNGVAPTKEHEKDKGKEKEEDKEEEVEQEREKKEGDAPTKSPKAGRKGNMIVIVFSLPRNLTLT